MKRCSPRSVPARAIGSIQPSAPTHRRRVLSADSPLSFCKTIPFLSGSGVPSPDANTILSLGAIARLIPYFSRPLGIERDQSRAKRRTRWVRRTRPHLPLAQAEKSAPDLAMICGCRPLTEPQRRQGALPARPHRTSRSPRSLQSLIPTLWECRQGPDAKVARYGERPNLVRLDERARARNARKIHVDIAANYSDHRRAAARIGDMAGGSACKARKKLPSEVRGAAGAGRGIREMDLPTLRTCHEIADARD